MVMAYPVFSRQHLCARDAAMLFDVLSIFWTQSPMFEAL
jgi:hypothetical protein